MGVLASVVDMLYRDPSPSRELSRCEIRDQTRCGVGGTLGYEHYMRVVTIYPFLNTIVSAEGPQVISLPVVVNFLPLFNRCEYLTQQLQMLNSVHS